MKKIRLLSLLLVLCMLVSVLSACGDKTPDSESSYASSEVSSSDVSDASDVSAEPERIDGTEKYEAAAKLFAESENLRISTTYSRTVTVGTEQRTENGTLDEIYLSYGKRDMSYYCESETDFGERTVELTETLKDGTVFMLYDGKGFYSPAEKEYELFIPDAELYGEITELAEPDENGNTVITLTDAESVESCFAYEYATVTEASAEAVIDENGDIVSIAYSAEYEQGAAHYDFRYSCDIERLDEGSLPSIDIPEDAKEYQSVNSVTAVKYFDESLMNLRGLGTYISDGQYYMLTMGMSNELQCSSTYSVFEYGDDIVCDFSMQKYSGWYDIDTGEWNQIIADNETKIIDNERTASINGLEKTDSLTDEEVREYCEDQHESLFFCVPDIENIKQIDITAFDGYVTLTVHGNSSYGKEIRKNVSDMLKYIDELEDIVDDYETKKIEFVLTVDIDTGYPVAMSTDYEGAHVFEGFDYDFGYERTVSITPASPEIYFDITDEQHPAFESEPADEDKAKPLFYKVTDSEGNVMWLLGTIHVGDNRTAFLPDEIYEAFDASDAAAFEIDLLAFNEAFELGEDEDLLELYSEAYLYENDTIDDNIDETLYRDAKELFDALGLGSYGDYIGYLGSAKPNMWSSILDSTYLSHVMGVYHTKGVDYRLLSRAKDAGKKVYEVEDRNREFDMQIAFSDDVHELNLYSSVYYPRSYYRTDMIAMFEAWCEGDYDELSELINTPADLTGMSDDEIEAYEEYNKALSDDRDALMLERAKEYLASGETVFYAVGLAHLLDEDTGLLRTLEEAGYTVELVSYSAE